MKTLEDFKNEVAIKEGYISWWHLITEGTHGYYNTVDDLEKASMLYAKYIQEETVRRCAEIASIGYDSRRPYDPYFVDKQSILNIERILK